MLLRNFAVGLGLMARTAQSIDVTLGDESSVKSAASEVAWNLLTFYSGNNTGDVPGWLCGAMMGTLIEYWHYTGDESYNDLVRQAIVHQAGEERDLMPQNQTRSMGNDDQGFWGLSAMLAAEYVFPDPAEDEPQYLELAQAVFNMFASRWDTVHCGGGLRWQVFDFNIGWNYKNSVSNGCFFNLGARLARYTGNDTYAEWAEKVWEWETKVGLIGEDWALHDGVTITSSQTCGDDMDLTEWSYNSGIWLHGSAVMHNYTGAEKWQTRTAGILEYGLKKFSKDNVINEQYCESHSICDNDQISFKGYYIRWLAGVNILNPGVYTDKIMPLLKSTATAAAKACTGSPTAVLNNLPAWKGHAGTACGFAWVPSTYDNMYGVPEQMNALSALYSTLDAAPPKSAKTGGTSTGDPAAGGDDEAKARTLARITTGDRVGAGFLTTLILAGCIGGCTFLIT
ncbi:mannan endo-1,6-alpha-mannosidase [Geosmithia morbida]|uniref:Mannan endo-1,6-alpha-mannosidase n=1 Tax=Geosmithia morbida TaxID=1094350 RepID=A0A9P4YPZ6_9HYPO|nr:mannan endo-1,6-alpha-mannosidase [Geosmithia morbida]KAF4120447.1 mannan endo-1,6-alpha-mannosidase [Geosmithia morbida]